MMKFFFVKKARFHREKGYFPHVVHQKVYNNLRDY